MYMIKYESRAALKRFIYIISISIAIGILLLTGKIISKVELAKNIEKENSITNKVNIATTQNEKNITSRGSSETRIAAKQEDSQTENTKITENTENNKDNTKQPSTETKKENNTKQTTTKNENKKSATNTIKISQVKISKDMDLTKRTGLSREDFIKLISSVKADTSGFFKQNAGTIYDLCKKYNINEIFFCGLISAESGWNIASNHRKTHNYISLMKNGKLISYGSVYQGLEVAAQKLHNNYLTPGGKFYHGKTLAGVKTCFCPSSTWVDLVYGRMKQIVK